MVEESAIEESRRQVVYIGNDSTISKALTQRYGVLFGNLRGWPAPPALPSELLVVETHSLARGDWDRLITLSRQLHRPAILLLDADATSRQLLSAVAADGLLPADVPEEHVIATAERLTLDSIFRDAAACVGAAGLRYPLSRFLAAAFTARQTKVGQLARALGMSDSTVRSQWRQFTRSDRLRLEDVLKKIALIRRSAGGTTPHVVREEVFELVHRCLKTPAEAEAALHADSSPRSIIQPSGDNTLERAGL